MAADAIFASLIDQLLPRDPDVSSDAGLSLFIPRTNPHVGYRS
jgi:hypothetical protein